MWIMTIVAQEEEEQVAMKFGSVPIWALALMIIPGSIFIATALYNWCYSEASIVPRFRTESTQKYNAVGEKEGMEIRMVFDSYMTTINNMNLTSTP